MISAGDCARTAFSNASLFEALKGVRLPEEALHKLSCDIWLLEGGFVLVHFSIQGVDDASYLKHEELLKHVPRGEHILAKLDDQGNLVFDFALNGMVKFFGAGRGNDDDSPDVDHSRSGNITAHEKWNGKFVSMAANRTGYLMVGTKGRAVVFGPDDVALTARSYSPKIHGDRTVASLLSGDAHGQRWQRGELLQDILQDISSDSRLAASVRKIPGYTCVGEYCDGKHFDPNVYGIVVFGLAGSDGKILSPDCTRQALNDAGITHDDIRFRDPDGTPFASLEEAQASFFADPDCIFKEGFVARFDDKTQVKIKTSSYKLFRRLRQCLLACGDDVATAFSQALRTILNEVDRDYWELSDDALYMFLLVLRDFCQYIKDTNVDTRTLGIDHDCEGFGTVFKRFMLETGAVVKLTPESRETDPSRRLSADKFLEKYDPEGDLCVKRKRVTTVVFTKGVQGSGKSYMAAIIANMLRESGKKVLVISQDQYHGLAGVFRHAYHEALKSEQYDFIIVARCNRTTKEYADLVVPGFKYMILRTVPSDTAYVHPYLVQCFRSVTGRKDHEEGMKMQDPEKLADVLISSYNLCRGADKVGDHSIPGHDLRVIDPDFTGKKSNLKKADELIRLVDEKSDVGCMWRQPQAVAREAVEWILETGAQLAPIPHSNKKRSKPLVVLQARVPKESVGDLESAFGCSNINGGLHMTLAYNKMGDIAREFANSDMTGFVHSNQVLGVKVIGSAVDEISGHKTLVVDAPSYAFRFASPGHVPHITMFIGANKTAKYSNELLSQQSWERLETPIELSLVVGCA